MNKQVMDSHFRGLLTEPLVTMARRWAEEIYPDVPITKIGLYTYSYDNYEPAVKEFVSPTVNRYAIVFEVDAIFHGFFDNLSDSQRETLLRVPPPDARELWESEIKRGWDALTKKQKSDAREMASGTKLQKYEQPVLDLRDIIGLYAFLDTGKRDGALISVDLNGDQPAFEYQVFDDADVKRAYEEQNMPFQRLLEAASNNALLTEDFISVYHTAPQHPFRNDWGIFVLFRNTLDQLPRWVKTKEPNVVLFPTADMGGEQREEATFCEEGSGRYIGSFIKQDKIWKITFKGKTVHINDLKGVVDITKLLRFPQRSFYPLALDGVVNSTETSAVDGLYSAEDYRFSSVGDADDDPRGRGQDQDGLTLLKERQEPTLTAEELKTMKNLLSSEWEKYIDAGTDDEKAKQRDIFEKVRRYALDNGLKCRVNYKTGKIQVSRPRYRLTNPESEAARSRISKRIETVLTTLEKSGVHPGLGLFLREHIHTGNSFCYKIDPDKYPPWKIDS